MFKKRARPTEGLRTASTSAEGDAAEESVVVPAATVKLSGLVTSSAKPKGGESVVMSFESSRTAVSAVASLVDLAADNEELEEDRAREARELQARAEAASDPSIYRGKGAYHEYVQKREKIDKKSCALGPIRAPTSIKTSSVFDYKPDVCKDYKETGYCTFGDSCKFAHMREDYKAGWQIERDWNEEMKQKRLKAEAAMKKMFAGEDEGSDEESNAQPSDDLPFACFICRERFEDPVETRCGHYFCETCALQRVKKSSRCAVCNEPTHGIFNTAVKIREAIRRSGGDPGKRDVMVQRPATEEDEFASIRAKSAATAAAERSSELGWRIGMSDAL